MLQFIKGLDSVVSIITAITLVAMMVHVVLHALMRSLFQAPLTGTNEIVAYWYLPLVALLGIPAAQLKHEHITVTLALERMRDKTATVFKVFACVVGALLSIAFAYYGLGEALSNMASGSTAGVTRITVWPVYFLVPVVFVLLAGLLTIHAAAILRGQAPKVDVVDKDRDEHDLVDNVV